MVWFTNPAKEVLNVLFNRILAPYVQNLDMNQVNYGIGQGELTLRNLVLKRGALDKFRLPIDVVEGHLGKFSLSLHWMNLGNQPVQVLVEDVYLLVVPSPASNDDPAEEEKRAQAAKMDRVKNAELLHFRGAPEKDEGAQSQGLVGSLIAKILNNLQVTVKNVHVRYEDQMSVPDHPFSAGLTLSSFTAASVDSQWQPAFIESTAGTIHKLGKLESLAIYFNTDTERLQGLSHEDSVAKFSSLIAREGNVPDHQYVLKPVSGEGRIVMNNRGGKDVPRFDVQLLFDEIGVVVDRNQYRDVVSLLDMFHFYARQHQYRTYRPSSAEVEKNRGRALISFAGKAILSDIHERNRRWTWAYFAERRDDRNAYVELFKKQMLNQLAAGGTDLQRFDALERKLAYEDIRFYRSIARSQLRKDLAAKKKVAEERARTQAPASAQGTWGGWLWGSAAQSTAPSQAADDPVFDGTMTEAQKKELYDMLDYDEQSATTESINEPADALKARVVAKLNKGSLALQSEVAGKPTEIISVVFDVFQANVLQRQENLALALALGGLRVFDRTTDKTLYSQIVHMKGGDNGAPAATEEPLFALDFESKPLDARADMALSVRLKPTEIIYHRGYVEAVVAFFKPPESQLESVEALLNVASQTLQGLRETTRAGLEFALQTHKTVDIHMDMSSPVIIIPEDITTTKCSHLIVDAGHIAIESDLADKESVIKVQSRRKQEYTEEDYKRLESLMYDKFTLKLESAQFILGNDLETCRRALTSTDKDTLHLLERTNLSFQVQNSIVPGVWNLARFKIAGNLPTLHLNFSDIKYKTLMTLVDTTIPRFDDDSQTEAVALAPARPSIPRHVSRGVWDRNVEYNVDDTDDEDAGEQDAEHFFDVPSSGQVRPELHQHVFELDFSVDEMMVALAKASGDGQERSFGSLSLSRFGLVLAVAKFDMAVDVKLRSLEMDLDQPGLERIRFMSSAEESGKQDKDLLTVKYKRAQREGPEFESLFEGIDQSVDMDISTVNFHAAPEPVVALFSFVMTTFVPPPSSTAPSPAAEKDQAMAVQEATTPSAAQKPSLIKVNVNLDGIRIFLQDSGARIATLSLSTAAVTVLVRSNTLLVSGRLGTMSLRDDSSATAVSSDFKDILSIEGENFADFKYETFDAAEMDSKTGVNSEVALRAASVRIHFVEKALRSLYVFVIKLATLKSLYDAAAQAAVQSASEIQRMRFDISVKSPIIVFPTDAAKSTDCLTMRLGELSAKNAYDGDENRMAASLHGLQLASSLAGQSTLKMIDEINIDSNIIATSSIDRSVERARPDTQVEVKISDVKLHLAQAQYVVLLTLAQTIPGIFAPVASLSVEDAQRLSPAVHTARPPPSSELHTSTSSSPWTTVDLVVRMNTIKLHLYDSQADTEETLQEHGIARFAINGSTLRLKMLNSGASEAELVMKSFTMSNTRPGKTAFREIIPAARHDRNQLMVLFKMSGPVENSAVAEVSIDAPSLIFAMDPVFALIAFFTSMPPTASSQALPASDSIETAGAQPPSTFHLSFSVDIQDLDVNVLEDDTKQDTSAISLSIKRIIVSQQNVLAVNVQKLGMSLLQMGNSTDSVRFLDEADLTLSMDNRSISGHNLMNLEMAATPIIFRASYRDINLILAIVNRAIALSTPPTPEKSTDSTALAQSSSAALASDVKPLSPGAARVVMAKEQLSANFEGFQLVLIADIHEQPELHLRVQPFSFFAKDWSAELRASTAFDVRLNYWNLTNSRWEPLIDPWKFGVEVSKTVPESTVAVTLSAEERVDFNISTTFVELALNMLSAFNTQGDAILSEARGSNAPYRVRNNTGSSIRIWSDTQWNEKVNDQNAMLLENGKSIDWRFEDWKTMREHVSSAGTSRLGVQFVGKPWDDVRSIPVDRAGEHIFSLRPRTEQYVERISCDVTVEDNIKVVTLRSTYTVHNETLYPLEVLLVDDAGQPVVKAAQKIVPGETYSLPIDSVARHHIRVQPDQGFGYKWSSALKSSELISKKVLSVKCVHSSDKEAPFRFHVNVDADVNDPLVRQCPKISVKLRAPIEIENLLPYNLEYRIYDKSTNQNWRSYLRKGLTMPIHTVELSHLVLLNVAVQDTAFKPSDFAIINTEPHSDFEIEKRLSVQDQSGRKMDVKLNYVRDPNAGGAFKVQVYTPYVVVNKTGLPFAIRSRPSRGTQVSDVAGETRSDVLSTPAPFMLSTKNERGHEFTFRLGNSGWSKFVSFEAPSAETAFSLPPQGQNAEEVNVGLSWTEGSGKYKLSKVVTLVPRFFVKNNLLEPLCFREYSAPPRTQWTLQPGERQGLTFMRPTNDKLLTLAFAGLNAEWAAPIKMGEIGTVHLRLRHPDRPAEVQLLRAEVQVDGSSIFIYIYSADRWPFLIENNSDYSASFRQACSETFRQDQGAASAPPSYTLASGSRVAYAWDFPAREKMIELVVNGARRTLDVMEIGALMPFKFSVEGGQRAVSLDVRAEGEQQVLRITNYVAERSLYKLKRRNTASSVGRSGTTRSESPSTMGDAFEAVTEEIAPSLSIKLDLQGIGVSLINRSLVEVVYLSITKLNLEYTSSSVAQSMTLACGSLQVDNQLHDALFPVVLQPTPIPKDTRGEVAALPTVQASFIWLTDQAHGVFFVKYCSVLLQALTVEADEDFLFAVYELAQFKGASWEQNQEDVLIPEQGAIPDPQPAKTGQDLYFEVFELQPVRVSISFMRTERVSSETKLSTRNPLAFMVNAVTMTLGNINDARLGMNALAIKDMRLTSSELQSRVIYHYRQEVLRQIYRVLGSADFIGNPIGLFENVSSGVADIFYEPFNGVVHGNRDIGVGLAKGAASFVKKSVFGVSDSITKITGSVGQGLSAATMDSDFQLQRRMNQRRNKPRHAIYGFAAGAEALATSLASGVEGVISKPIEGAESGGAGGFFKGVGKGLVGVPTKLGVGLFDFASNVAEGVRNTTTVFDNPARDRVRLPRLVRQDGILVPFSQREALGQYWLKDLENGRYRKELYVAHINLPEGDNVAILTSTRMLSIWCKRLKLDWDLGFSSVQAVTAEDKGIRLAHKGGKQYDKFLLIPDKKSQSWFFEQIATVVKNVNLKRRMD